MLPTRPAESDTANVRAGRSVAFFGGSFDPPHLGHLAIARAAQKAFALDRVMFAPVGAQPLKPDGLAANYEDRVAMTKLAIADDVDFEVSLADAPNPDGKANYTFDTLTRVHSGLGKDDQLYCLIGADSFVTLPRWHRAAEIPYIATLIVASRPGQEISNSQIELPQGLSAGGGGDSESQINGVAVRTFEVVDAVGRRAEIHILPGLHVEISASAIRNSLTKIARSADSTLPEPVRDYIDQHRLYR